MSYLMVGVNILKYDKTTLKIMRKTKPELGKNHKNGSCVESYVKTVRIEN